MEDGVADDGTVSLLGGIADADTPAFVYDEEQLITDAEAVRQPAGPEVRLLLEMKAFTVEVGLRVVAPVLDGLHSSSLLETGLARRGPGPLDHPKDLWTSAERGILRAAAPSQQTGVAARSH